jgi:hypothetical protein
MSYLASNPIAKQRNINPTLEREHHTVGNECISTDEYVVKIDCGLAV